MYPDITPAQPKRLKLPLLMLGAGAVVLLLVAGWVVFRQATTTPKQADFAHLNNQRVILDTSMNAYDPLMTDYANAYINAYQEERPLEETTALRDDYRSQFEREMQANTNRLQQMESSVALREPAVADSFKTFKDRYEAVIGYYERYGRNVAVVAESVGGPCARLSELNVAKASYAADYVKAADTCLTKLDEAKKGSDEATTSLLTSVEKLVKERRTKFADTLGKDDFERSARLMMGLALMLGTNADVSKAQAEYQAKVDKEYIRLVEQANASNKDLEETLQKYLSQPTAAGSEA